MHSTTTKKHYEINISKPNETLEQKLKRMCLLIVNKNNYAVGIENNKKIAEENYGERNTI